MKVILVIFVLLQHIGPSKDTSLVSLRTVTEVLVNHSTYLSCSASLLSDDIHWYHYDVGAEEHEMRSVYAYGQIYEFYRDDFSIDNNITNATNSYNLLILSAKSKYAGTYLCQLFGSEDRTISMQLIILETMPLCLSNMKLDGIIGPNSCGMEQEKLQLSCSIKFTGNIPPQLEWRAASWNGSVQGNVTEETADSIYKYNIAIKSDLYMDGSFYVCQTASATGSQLNCTSDVVKVQYIFSTSYITDILVNDEVNCSANTSSRSCHYKWFWFNDTNVQTESSNQTLKIQSSGQHRCEATCEIRKQQCTVIASLVNATQTLDYTTIGTRSNDSKDNRSASVPIVLACLSGACACIIAFLLVVFVRHRKHGGRQSPDTEVRTATRAELKTLTVGTARMAHLESCTSEQAETEIRTASRAALKTLTVDTAHMANLESRASEQGESSKTIISQVEDTGLEDAPQELHVLLQDSVHYDTSAKAVCMMRLEDEEETPVIGLTMLNKELFILFQQSSEVHVYQAELLILLRSLLLEELQNPVDIASSSIDNCLFISSGDEIVRLDGNGEIISIWSIERGGGTLSVSQDRTVILSVWAKNLLQEYSAMGDLMNEVGLPSGVHLLHAVKTKDLFAICIESQMENGVWLVNVCGHVIKSFRGMIKFPKYLAVNSDGCVFVVDERNSCVLLLSKTLECLKVLLSSKDELICPSRICLDEDNSRMFVADGRESDVKVIAFALWKIQTGYSRLGATTPIELFNPRRSSKNVTYM